MTIGTALRTHILADASIAALVASRVYPLRLPQFKPSPAVNLPAIVLQRISEIRFAHLRGAEALARPRFQVDCWATTHDGATTLGALVRQRLNGYAGEWADTASPPTTVRVVVLFDTAQDLFEEDINGGICRQSSDYFLFHSTANGTV